jgi:hypothetical protein
MLPENWMLALLLPLPPWLGFWIFRRKGRVGLSYGYFLGGILALLTLPWPHLVGKPFPSAHMGGALFGFTLFLQAHREGGQGLRRLGVGVGGASIFSLLLMLQLEIPLQSLLAFWATAIGEALLWLLLSDLLYALTRGRWLQARMPAVGGLTLTLGSLMLRPWPDELPRLPWPAAALAGVLLGLVALQQLLWLRANGTWVEGRGEALRTALSLLERGEKPEGPSLAYTLEATQGMVLVNEKGLVLEANGPLARAVGFPRHQLRGYRLNQLVQGEGQAVWEDLQTQLLQHGCGKAGGTLADAEGGWAPVTLEAVAFDRNMALVWISSPEPATLALRGSRGSAVLLESQGTSIRLANTLGTILPAAEHILATTQEPETRTAAERILVAAQKVRPSTTDPDVELPALDAMDALIPWLQRMLPPHFKVGHQGPDLLLRTSPESLKKIATHLLLHARQAITRGTLTLTLTPRVLGGRTWALMGVEVDGPPGRAPRELLGSAWLQEAVRMGRGMLELNQDPEGGLWPSIYLPVVAGPTLIESDPLRGRTAWIVDQDPGVRDALASLVVAQGGRAEAFGELKDMLRASRDLPAPDLLVLERTSQLMRFHRALRGFQREPLPTLVLGNGEALPVNPGSLGLRRLGFLDKPFPSQEFIQSLLALLSPTG